MIGPYINAAAVLTGGIFGVLLKRHVPKHLEEALPQTFSLVALSLGVLLLVKVQNMPPVVLALIFGTAFGELVRLESAVTRGAGALQKIMSRYLPHGGGVSEQEFAESFATLLTLFCASSMGIIGALTEGISGDYQFLIIKAILDFFTALIFAISLGISVSLIAVPLLAVQASLFYLARLIMPLMDTITYGDFSACGGLIMLGVGFRMAGIKKFHVINFLPTLILAVPFSILWQRWF